MTSVREVLHRLINRQMEVDADEPRPYYSYRIFWTKMVRDWPKDKRQKVGEDLNLLISAESFEANPLERRYTVESLREGKFAGASLLALQEVLKGFSEYETNQEES